MKTIQITIDDKLLSRIDRQCGSRNRSAFFRSAAQAFLKQLQIQKLEQQHIRGYKQHPPSAEEFAPWVAEQVWPDEQR